MERLPDFTTDRECYGSELTHRCRGVFRGEGARGGTAKALCTLTVVKRLEFCVANTPPH
ncbi:Olfactory receptor 1J2 [Clarias magur]|uniref:Olfactory receptor 1J2 n=1 Tax=Clarias magur TaxID=1594786 RepID=A0A8J4XEH8_CLAMG|nr:Olfactory receptor 1J2 [Clarias magur]